MSVCEGCDERGANLSGCTNLENYLDPYDFLNTTRTCARIAMCTGIVINDRRFVGQDRLDEKSGVAEKLTKQIECKQDESASARKELADSQATAGQLRDRCGHLETEVARVRAQLDDCRSTESGLRDRSRGLETDLERARAELEAVKSSAAVAQTRLRAEAAAAAEQLEHRARSLQQADTERDQAERRAADERGKADGLDAQAAELRAAAEPWRGEAEVREGQLKREACERDEQARVLDEQLAAVRWDGQQTVAEAETLETRCARAENQLAAAKRLETAAQILQAEALGRLEADKVVLSDQVRRKTAAVAELERQEDRLRDEIRSRSCDPVAQFGKGASRRRH